MEDNLDETFAAAWAAYPRKQAKADARRAWRQTSAIRPPQDLLLSILANHCKQEQWNRDGGAYIPLFSSWLRGERWADQLKIELPRQPDRYDRANQEFTQRYDPPKPKMSFDERMKIIKDQA